MQIRTWIKQRTIPGTIADLARRILESDDKYRAAERTLRSMYVLEALAKNGGSQQRAAAAIGVSTMTIKRVVRGLSLTATDIRRVAKHLEGIR